MASILNEFNSPSPCPAAFCQRISSEEFEHQTAETTESELGSLMKYLENNPTIYYEALRKKKSDNLGLFELVKVKVMTALQGDEYLENYFPDRECKTQLDALKGEMVLAYDYGQEAKGSSRRFSKRLASKRKAAALQSNSKISNPPPPPPPPPPVVTRHCTLIGETKENPERKLGQGYSKSHLVKPCLDNDADCTVSGTFKSRNDDLLQSIRGVSGRKRIRGPQATTNKETQITSNKENSDCSTSNPTKKTGLKKSISRTISKTSMNLKNLQDEINNAKKKLRCIGDQSSPTNTPYHASKERRRQQQPEEQFPFFNLALVERFKNARSPPVSPSGDFNDSGFGSPLDC